MTAIAVAPAETVAGDPVNCPANDTWARMWARVHAEIKEDRARVMALDPAERDALMPQFNAHVQRLRHKEQVETEHRAFLKLSPEMQRVVWMQEQEKRLAKERHDQQSAYDRDGWRGVAKHIMQGRTTTGAEMTLMWARWPVDLSHMNLAQVTEVLIQVADDTYQPEYAFNEVPDPDFPSYNPVRFRVTKFVQGERYQGMAPPVGGLLRERN
jgi:hypothetical protein